MDFFKQAQNFAGSGNTNTDHDNSAAPAASDGEFGSFMNSASNMLKSQDASAGDGSAAPASLPGGCQAPTDQGLLQSGQVLFGAARGQQVDPSQLAGAASDLLGGLAAHGNLDQGAYGTYINQAEDYLNKYAGQGQSAGAAAPRPAAASAQTDSQAPRTNDMSNDPSTTADQSDGFQSTADQSAQSASMNAPTTGDYAPDRQTACPPSSTDDSQY